MKWYNSVKIKLVGFFLLIATIFLLTIIIIFSIIKKETLHSNASKETTAITADILREIRQTQNHTEEIAKILASVAKEDIRNPNVINSILSADPNSAIISGGIWFEPYAKNRSVKDHWHLFHKDDDGHFIEVHDGNLSLVSGYRHSEFYKTAKTLQRGQTHWSNVYEDDTTHNPLITVVSPIYKNGLFIGAVNINLAVNNLFGKNMAATNMYLLMIDKEGTVIGKSSTFNNFFKKENNVLKVHHPLMEIILSEVKPALIACSNEHGEKSCPISEINTSSQTISTIGLPFIVKKDAITNHIYFIENDPILDTQSIIAVYHFPATHWKVMIGIPEYNVLSYANTTYKQILLATIIVTLIATILGYFLLKRFFITPIESINIQLKNNFSNFTSDCKTLKCDDKGEIGMLVENLNARTIALKNSLNREEQEIQKRMLNEKLLIQQSKMAAMGEMMDCVAHQWKQPLNALSLYSELIKSDYESGIVNEKYIKEFRQDIQLQINHMVTTLDEFRNFFRPNKENQQFNIKDIINSVIFLTKDDFLRNHITVTIEQDDTISLIGSENEFKHVFLNLFNNAKDAFNEHHISDRKISIRLMHDDEFNTIEVEDNAGGIPEYIMETIFEANVTTKAEGKGTGIGLYLAKRIAKKYGGIFSVHNTLQGACFVLQFKKEAIHIYADIT